MTPLALAISGKSGSGKTSLIEALLPRLAARGLSVGVFKSASHPLNLDHPGKDTERIFQAGADFVAGWDGSEMFFRRKENARPALSMVEGTRPERSRRGVIEACPGHGRTGLLGVFEKIVDLVIVEGWKGSTLPKIWLGEKPADVEPGSGEVLAVFDSRLSTLDSRCSTAESVIWNWLNDRWTATPPGIAILIGGKSRRMGSPKALLPYRGKTFLEEMVKNLSGVLSKIVLVGDGPVPDSLARNLPLLPDAPGALGPLAGLLSLFRWDGSQKSWIVLACDMPYMEPRYIEWLCSKRRPGLWAILPEKSPREGFSPRFIGVEPPVVSEVEPPVASKVEPLAALFEPQATSIFETAFAAGKRSLCEILHHPKVERVSVPRELLRSLTNVNFPVDFLALGNAARKTQVAPVSDCRGKLPARSDSGVVS